VFQAAKAITGGVIALKGQLIKAKGHAVVAKGKLMQTKGEAISNFGKTIATHAFDVHHEPQLDVHSSVGLFNHLPVTPIHQPTSKYFPLTVFPFFMLYSISTYTLPIYRLRSCYCVWISRTSVPEQRVPEQLVPEQRVPQQRVPEQRLF